MRSLVIILSILFLLFGCANQNNSTDYTQADLIFITGKTTKEEVKKKFGEPSSSHFDKNGERWIYIDDPMEKRRMLGNAGALANIPLMFVPGYAGIGLGLAAGHAPLLSDIKKKKGGYLIITFDKNGILKEYDYKIFEQ